MIYELKSPDGITHKIEGPDGATQEQVLEFANYSGLLSNKTNPAEPGLMTNISNAVKQHKESIAYSTSPEGMLSKLSEHVSTLAGMGGKFAEQELVKSGINPTMANVTGKVIKYSPDVAMMGMPAEEVPAIAKSVSTAIANKIEPIANTIKGSGAKDVATISERLAELPLKQTAKRTAAQTLKIEAGKGIGEAEKPLNVGISKTSSRLMSDIARNKDKTAKFADRASILAEKGAEKLAEIGSPETLQFYRKTAQMAARTADPLLKPKLYEINRVFGEALSKQDKPFAEAMNKYKDIEKVIKELPAEFTKQKQLLNLALTKAKNVAKKQAPIRKALGYTGAAGATGLGFKLGKHLISED